MDWVKKTVLAFAALMVALPFCLAAEPSADELCTAKGFDFGISRHFWINGSYIEESSLEGFNVMVEGNARRLNWSSDTFIDGVIYKTTRTYTSEGGYNGTIPKTSLSSDVNFVVFCGRIAEIPDFGAFGLFIASFLGLLLCVTYRK